MLVTAGLLGGPLCWMDESASLVQGKKYAIKHTTRWARALVMSINYRAVSRLSFLVAGQGQAATR